MDTRTDPALRFLDHDLPAVLRDLPEWWLGVLGRALARGNYAAAADADRHLARLGYTVRVRPAPDRAPAQEAPDASR